MAVESTIYFDSFSEKFRASKMNSGFGILGWMLYRLRKVNKQIGRSKVVELSRRGRLFIIYALLLFAFLSCWFLFTLLILFTQDKFFGDDGGKPLIASRNSRSYYGQGVQLLVGHYNGGVGPEGHSDNLTDEDFNANDFHPEFEWGEMGYAANLLEPHDLIESQRTFRINQFSLYVSNRISLKRSLPDVRKNGCRQKIYPRLLPKTSVIIVFHNEAFSTLCRTAFLRKDLEFFLRNTSQALPIKLIRSAVRLGLIRARLIGAQESRGNVLTFLDSHCEVTIGWLEPLIARVHENRRVVACPVIDVINDRTFAYQRGIEAYRGGFNWGLQFRWYAMPSEKAKKRSSSNGTGYVEPIPSPTMAGGLFSIDKKYFEQIGTYDPMMELWGGENIELSFRVWQCGGRVEILPCSHVGHVFRKASPHDFSVNSSRILNANLARVAEVWMDDWNAKQYSRIFDVSARLELRRRLHCKDFAWYLDNVWPEHFLPRPNAFFGRVLHSRLRLCLLSRPSMESNGQKKHVLSMDQCSLGFDIWQLWVFTNGQLKSDEHQCLGAVVAFSDSQWTVRLNECSDLQEELWDYNKYRQQFVHRVSGLCLSEPSGTFGLLSRRRLQLTAAAEKRKAGASEMKLLPELIPCKKWDYYTQQIKEEGTKQMLQLP